MNEIPEKQLALEYEKKLKGLFKEHKRKTKIKSKKTKSKSKSKQYNTYGGKRKTRKT